MLALIRRKLRTEFRFPSGPKRYFSVPAVYSLENVRYPQSDGSVCGTRPQLGADAALKLDCGAGLGAGTHITGAFAFAAVGKVLELRLRHQPPAAKAAPRSAGRKPRSTCMSQEDRKGDGQGKMVSELGAPGGAQIITKKTTN